MRQHLDEAEAEQRSAERRCDENAGGCGRSAEEGAAFKGRSALCESCKEAIAEAEVDDAAKLEEAKRLLAPELQRLRDALSELLSASESFVKLSRVRGEDLREEATKRVRNALAVAREALQ